MKVLRLEEIGLLKESEKSTVLLMGEVDGEKRYIQKKLQGQHPVYEVLQGCASSYLPEIYEVSLTETETIVLEEYIEGQTLAEAVLSEKQARNIMGQLCDALSFLHGKGIIHRDVKPSNIMLAPHGRIRLIDFDAARMMKDSGAQDTQRLGTREYAPPEQYGFSQTDQRADIYALGITFREILGSRASRWRYHEMIKKCTDLNPNRRYQTVAAVKRALRLRPLMPMAALVSVVALALLWWCLFGAPPQETLPPTEPVMQTQVITESVVTTAPPSTTSPETTAAPTEAVTEPDEPSTEAEFTEPEPEPTEPKTEPPDSASIPAEVADRLIYTVNKSEYIALSSAEAERRESTAMSVDMTGKGDWIDFEVVGTPGLWPMGVSAIVAGGTALQLVTESQIQWCTGIPYQEFQVFDVPPMCQITCIDLDGDGVKEVLSAMGNRRHSLSVSIWRFIGGTAPALNYCGLVWGVTTMEVTATGAMQAEIDRMLSDNLYVYAGGEISFVSGTDIAAFKDYQLGLYEPEHFEESVLDIVSPGWRESGKTPDEVFYPFKYLEDEEESPYSFNPELEPPALN